MRKFYLDNLRWTVVLAVIVYHAVYLFNAEGVPGGLGSFTPVQYQDVVLYTLYPWFMALLFVVSGICSWYSLQRQSPQQYLKKRTVRLLVPATLGLLVFQWISGYLNLKISGTLTMMPAFLVYPVAALSGTGPLWFIQMLWLFDVLLVLIRKIPGADHLHQMGDQARFWQILLLGLVFWGSSFILNMPVLTMYRFGIYFFSFLTGYFLFSSENVQLQLQNAAPGMMAASCIWMVWFTTLYFGRNYTENAVLQSFVCNAFAWSMILTLLGAYGRWFDWTSRFCQYMSRISFGLYILHFTCELYPAWYLKTYTDLPSVWIYLTVLLCGIFGSALLYGIFSRIPFIRFAVLGIRKEKQCLKDSHNCVIKRA